MNKSTALVLSILLYLFIQFCIISCANVGSPTGGPKDTIPPRLVNANPSHGTLNFDGKTIRLEFNEPIQAKDLTNQLIITPSTGGKYKTKFTKTSIELSFEQPFDTNTTYTLNFREGLVDMNESNPARDLLLAFSTGKYLDSLEISGQIKEALTGKAVSDALVSLYRANDTLNTFNSRPYYLQKTNKEGFYHFRNLKVGKYLIYSTKDLNKNLKTESKSEPFGFLKDTIRLNKSIDSVNIKILSINTLPIQINSSRPSGKYYDITLNKAIIDYDLQPLYDNITTIYSNVIDNGRKIRVYNTNSITDSLPVMVSAKDSIHQQLMDTLYIHFEDSRRAKEEFKFTIDPKTGSAIQEDFSAKVSFNKPILSMNYDSIFFQYDSLTIVKPDTGSHTFTWNKRKDVLTINTKLNSKQPSLKPESLSEELPESNLPTAPRSVTLYMGKKTFFSVDNDTSTTISANYTFADSKNFGIISGKITLAYDNTIVQLLQASNYNLVREVMNSKNFTFKFVPPGDYIIRVLIDENANGKWDPGNVHLRIEPEPIYIHTEKITLKANWEITDLKIGE